MLSLFTNMNTEQVVYIIICLCILLAFFLYKYSLKIIGSKTKRKKYQNTIYETKYNVPHNNYDYVKAPILRKRNSKINDIQPQEQQNVYMKNRKQYNNTSSLNEPVSLPFPLGKNNNTTYIKNAKLGKLPEKASSVLIESNIPLPLGCQRKIPEIPYDFFGDKKNNNDNHYNNNNQQQRSNITNFNNNLSNRRNVIKKSRRISPPSRSKRRENVESSSTKQPPLFSPFVSPVHPASNHTPLNITIKKPGNNSYNNNIHDNGDNNNNDFYNRLDNPQRRRGSSIFRALSPRSPDDRQVEDAAKREQTKDVNYGEIERKVQNKLHHEQHNNNNNNYYNNNDMENNTNFDNIMNNFDRLREQARREKNARMKEFQRLEKRRNDDEVRVQNKLDQLHQQELEEQRLKDQKIRDEEARKRKEKHEQERQAQERKRKQDEAMQKKKEKEIATKKKQEAKRKQDEAKANAKSATRDELNTNFKQLAEEYDKRAEKADAEKDKRPIKKAVNKLQLSINQQNVIGRGNEFINDILNNNQLTQNKPALQDYARIYLLRKILHRNVNMTAKKEDNIAHYKIIFHHAQLILEISLIDKDFCNMFLGSISSIREFKKEETSIKSFPYLFRNDIPVYRIKIEPINKLTDRILYIASIYAAFVQSRPINNAKMHPHGIKYAWVFMANILNLDKQFLSSYHGFGIYQILLICSHRLFRQYNKQFLKLVKLIQNDFLTHIESEECKDQWHEEKKNHIYDVNTFINEAILQPKPRDQGGEMNEKDIFLKFAHSHVERDELERSNNNNNNEFRIGSLPIGHFKRLPAKPPN